MRLSEVHVLTCDWVQRRVRRDRVLRVGLQRRVPVNDKVPLCSNEQQTIGARNFRGKSSEDNPRGTKWGDIPNF